MTQNEWILSIVKDFYQEATSDVLIGYHFRVITNFDEHIPRIAAFWELQLLGQSSAPIKNNFDIMKVHFPLGIKRGELGRWLVLFKKTLDKKVQINPEFQDLKQAWEIKLDFFEGVFLRFFRF